MFQQKYSSPTQLSIDPVELIFHKRIARGAFGSVYLATDPDGHKYAVKRSRKFGMKRSRELINLGLCKDAQNIMQYMGTFYTRNRQGIVMQNSLFEHVPHNLRAFIRYLKSRTCIAGNGEDRTFCPENAGYLNKVVGQMGGEIENVIIQILCHVVNGILELHERGLVHRDLKPDNVLIDNDQLPTFAKICDLGSAKKINRLCLTANSEADLRPTPSTPYVCSRWYRAPELLFGRTFYSASVDNWSFGCICAEMLLLRPLFASMEQTDSHQVVNLIELLGNPSKSELKRLLDAAPSDAIGKQLELLFQTTNARGSLRVILMGIAKGNQRLMTIANVAYNLLRWCPEDRISMEDAGKMLNAGLRRTTC